MQRTLPDERGSLYIKARDIAEFAKIVEIVEIVEIVTRSPHGCHAAEKSAG